MIDVSSTPGLAEGEPYAAFNPRRRQNVILGSNEWQPLTSSNSQDYIGLGPSGFTSCAVWASQDGGRHWQGGAIDDGFGPVTVPHLAPAVPSEFDDPGNVFSADQSTVFDRHGNAYYGCINFGSQTGVEALNVWRSSDGGRSWSKPVAAFSQANDLNRQMDRPWLSIDQTRGPYDGTLYMVWETIFYDPVHPEIYVRSSRDGGRSWGPITRIDNDAHPSMWDARLFPMIGADGTLYVVYDSARLIETPFGWQPQVDSPSITLAASKDGGRTFTYHPVQQNIDRPSPPDEAEQYFTEFIPSMATDPRRRGRVAVAWPELVNGECRIRLRSSLDGGNSWTPPTDVADDPPGKYYPPDTTAGLPYPQGQGNEHDHVAVRYLPNGRLLVVWRDRRFTGGAWSKPWDIFARVVRVAPNGTLHPGHTIRITEHSEDPSTAHRGHMPSEYLSVAVRRDGVGFGWEEMHGFYPDVVYRFVPMRAFGG